MSGVLAPAEDLPPGTTPAAGSPAGFGGNDTFAPAAAQRRSRLLARRPTRTYWPALDGLRAVAVVAVMLYHAGVAAVPGGLLGVDVFFVLSGFLITGLLLDEHARTGTVRLAAFWLRRVRRLLPALLALLIGVAVYAAVLARPDDVPSIRLDALSALAYVANWRFAFSGQSYFDHFGDPSPLLHLWSLGVEEQFYLIWPVLVLLVTLRQRRGTPFVAVTAAILLVASTSCLVLLNAAGATSSRLYYGTDTRSLSLLAGALLACWVASRRRAGRHRRALLNRSADVLLAVIGVAGAAALGWAFLAVPGEDPVLYRGGFLAIAACAAAVVASVVLVPRSPLARLLALTPLVALGRISYAVYLWHWPLFIVLNGSRTSLTGPSLLAVRLLAAVLAGTLSFLLVERPIRSRRLPRLGLLAPAASLVTAGIVLAATVPGVLPGEAHLAAHTSTGDLTRLAAGEAAARKQALATPSTPRKIGTEPVHVLIVGDSVGLTVGVALRQVAPQWKVEIVNGGIAGCGIAPGRRGATRDRSVPDQLPCDNWPTWWHDAVNIYKPDVVLLISGHWELSNRYLNGKVRALGDPDFDTQLSAAFDRGIDILSARGAAVGLVTSPCIGRTEQLDGSLDPASSPTRIGRYNDLLRQAGARHPGVTTMLDLKNVLCPNGRYVDTLDGVSVRTDDGTHVDRTAGPVIAPLLLGGARSMVGLPPRPTSR